MKLELFDAYHVRARLSASIILLAPIALTLFLCFQEVHNFASSSVLIFFLLAFTNYVPILQRNLACEKNINVEYAAQLLFIDDTTFDSVSKNRYYNKLAKLDDSFKAFEHPDNSEDFKKCCKSAVIYLRNQTRGNRLVLEENINYGFCKNLKANKVMGIIMCFLSFGMIALISLPGCSSASDIPTQNILAFTLNAVILLFWSFGVTDKTLDSTARYYGKALIMAIDAL